MKSKIYKKPRVFVKKIKVQVFLRKKSLPGLESPIYLACAPSESCCGIAC